LSFLSFQAHKHPLQDGRKVKSGLRTCRENFEQDIRRLWNARPHKYREKLRIRDEDELLRRLIQLESRDLSRKYNSIKGLLEWYLEIWGKTVMAPDTNQGEEEALIDEAL
jgi:hypothetical protein